MVSGVGGLSDFAGVSQLETASKHFPDVCPVKVMGEVTTEEIQRALTGYISKKTLEEAGTTVDEALRDRRFDPFQVGMLLLC